MDIRLENVSKRYGPQLAVDDISFTVRTGEVVGFLGPNGAGKSTTMKMITSYLSIGSGDIYVGGKPVRTQGQAVRRHIGYLPENNPLYEDMPVMDFLSFCAGLQGVAAKDVDARVKEMVKVCGLDREKHKRIHELSKGYRQRTGLARALIHDPEVLILDEPTTGLDPNQIVEIRNLIRELGKNKTVILSTHILTEVEATCDRILIISKGRIVADGNPETLRKQATGAEVIRVRIEDAEPPLVAAALMELPTVAQVKSVEGSVDLYEIESQPGQQSARNIFNLCASKGWIITSLVHLETRLEDIFRDLTVEPHFHASTENRIAV